MIPQYKEFQGPEIGYWTYMLSDDVIQLTISIHLINQKLVR